MAMVIYAVGTRSSARNSSLNRKDKSTQSLLPWNLFGIQHITNFVHAVANGTVLSYMDRIWDIHGDTYTMNILGTKVIFTRDAANIRQIFSIQWLDYDTARGIRTEMFKHVAPESIFATDGKEWEDNRRKWRRSLAHHDKLLDLPFLERSFKLLVCHVPAGEAVDLQSLSQRLFTDILANCIIGESTHCLDVENQSKETRESLAALKRLTGTMTIKGALGPLSRFIPQIGFKSDCRLFKNYIGHAIQNRLNVTKLEKADELHHPAQQESLLDRFMTHNDNCRTLNNDLTAAVLATESVAHTLSHTIWLLCQNPVIYEKLRQSVLDIVQFQEPTYEQLNKFTYLRNVLTECEFNHRHVSMYQT
jgi:cytochrome P450